MDILGDYLPRSLKKLGDIVRERKRERERGGGGTYFAEWLQSYGVLLHPSGVQRSK